MRAPLTSITGEEARTLNLVYTNFLSFPYRSEWRDVTMTLLEPHADLYAFGIFGRDFTKDLGQERKLYW